MRSLIKIKSVVLCILFTISGIAFSQPTVITDEQWTVIFNKIVDELVLQTAYDQTSRSELKAVFLHPRTKAVLIAIIKEQKITTVEEAEKAGNTLGHILRTEGGKRLTPEDQYKSTVYIRKGLDFATDAECAAIIKRQPPNLVGRHVLKIYESLPITEYNELLKLSAKSFITILNDKNYSVVISNEEIIKLKAAYGKLIQEKLKEQNNQRIFSNMNKAFDNNDDKQICEVGKLLLDTMITNNRELSISLVNAWIQGKL